MKKVFLYILLVISVFVYSNTDYTFLNISFEQGLPGNNIKDLYIDSRGIMWISVEGLGLCRYDGHKFLLLSNNDKNTSSISSNFINKIQEDKNGYLWMATDFGLCKYDHVSGNFINYFHNPDDSTSIPDNVILSIDKDEDDNLWISTANGFAKVDPERGSFQRYLYITSDQQNLVKFRVLKVYMAKNGTLWIGHSSGLLKYYQDSKGKYKLDKAFDTENVLVNHKLYDLIEDHFGNLWIATNKGLYKINIGVNKIIKWKFKEGDNDEINQNGVISFIMYNDINLWVGTWTRGMVIINTLTDNYQRITVDNNIRNGLRSDHIRSIYKDNLGSIWIGTKYGGIHKYIDQNNLFNSRFEKYNILKEINNVYLVYFYEDKDEKIWIGTKFSGLYMINLKNKIIKNYQYNKYKKYSVSSDQVQAILRDSKDNLWIGTKKGLDYFNEKLNRFEQINDRTVNCIFEDRYKNLWIGTEKGIRVLNKKRKEIEKYKEAADINFFNSDEFDITKIVEDSEGYVWFLTKYKGTFRYHPSKKIIFHFSKEENNGFIINSNMLRDIYEDDNNIFWFATKEAGLIKYNINTRESVNYTVSNGLPSNMIMCIQKDYLGNLWLGTNNGISKFETKNKTFVNFNVDYGIKSSVNEQGASHRFEDGAVLFGGSEGFNLFYPKDIYKTAQPDKIALSAVKVFSNPILRDLVKSSNIVLKYNQNFLSFEFHLVNYNHPSRHQFLCKMEGVDADWSNLGNRNYASYTNLKPGKYKFMVKGINELGVWSFPVEINIKILSPWWQKWWFRIFVFVVLITLAYFVNKIRVTKNNKHKRELESKVELRTKELNDINNLLKQRQQQIEEQANKLTEINKDLKASNATKDKLFSIIAHDLKNPFGAVLGLTEVLLKRFDRITTERKIEMLRLLNRSARKIFDLLDNLLQWSWSQSEKIKTIPEKISVKEIIKLNVDLLLELFKQKNILTKIKIEGNLFIMADRQMVNAVIRNILNNAIKFTDGGSVEITAKKQDAFILFTICDTGIGISRSKIDNIFKIDKDKSSKGTRGEQGSGLGLILCYEFVKINGGNISVESEENKGACFSFTFPEAII